MNQKDILEDLLVSEIEECGPDSPSARQLRNQIISLQPIRGGTMKEVAYFNAVLRGENPKKVPAGFRNNEDPIDRALKKISQLHGGVK